ncbi:uncharacterized protein LOC128675845 [Plodia interpunctella]|uniref:uncharacterized protein LOC128675845 n=1 Tax=Plodia interpunctella TaxID=58824 RepID=UPI0023684F31|nr:uncharacterized protein LOC128675845 [Plodia interpunctella]
MDYNIILYSYCKNIYLVGSGNFWSNENEVGDDNSISYRLYSLSLFSIYIVMTILEIIAVLYGNFPEDESSDALTFAVSHTIVLIKMFSVISNKKLVRSMNESMIKVCKKHEQNELVLEMYRTVKINVIGYFVTVYGASVFYVFEGLRKMYSGSHFVTIVTYYPSFEDNSMVATLFRVFTTAVLFMMMMTMIVSVDSFTMAYLIMLKYKFKTLRHYFERLRLDFDKINKSGDQRLAAEKLTDGLVEGIVMHQKLLKLGKNIDQAFGTVIAMQLILSSGSAVSLLLQIALSDQLTFIASMKIIFFVAALFFLLGLFLCNAGEITYQASLLSEAIFHCGWHACPPLPPPHRNHQHLVRHACAQALQPPIMKAFKMIELTYSTFLTVLRSTYSVFALFYAQKK